MIVAVFEWADDYTETIRYPKKVRGLVRDGKKPTELKVLIKDAKVYDSKMSEWFSCCYAAIHKGD